MARGVLRLADFDRERGAAARQPPRLHALGLGGEKRLRREGASGRQRLPVALEDDRVGRIASGVVVNIDGEPGPRVLHQRHQLVGQRRLRRIAPFPNAVEVHAARHRPPADFRRGDIADEQQHRRAKEFAAHLPHRVPTRYLVAVQQHREEERRRAFFPHVEQGRPAQRIGKLRRRQGRHLGRQAVRRAQAHQGAGQACTGSPLSWAST